MTGSALSVYRQVLDVAANLFSANEVSQGKGALGGEEGRQQKTYVFGVFTVLFPMCFICVFLFTFPTQVAWQKEKELGLLLKLLLLRLKDWGQQAPLLPPTNYPN